MDHVFPVVVFLAIMAFLFWLFVWPTPKKAATEDKPTGSIIDPEDSYKIGLILGMAGGSFTDAVIARHALQRFQEMHGRPAMDTDMATLLGIVRGAD